MDKDMNKQDEAEINEVIAKYMGEDFCLCRITNICPSPSAHSEHCLNEECKRVINNLSYKPYTRSLDSLLPVIEKAKEEVPCSLWISISTATLTYVELRIFNTMHKYKQKKEDWGDEVIEFKGKSPSLTLAQACYRIIKEM